MTRRLAFINPNSTEAMTASCAASLQAGIGDDFDVRAVTNHDGPPAIQGEEDGKAAVPGLLDAMTVNDDCDGFILGCFDDTGLAEARAMTDKPVIGIGQASFHLAALRGGRFQVLTTLEVSVPVIRANVANQGFAGVCTAILASGVPVLELEHNPEQSAAIISDHIAAIERTTVEHSAGTPTIILGCAGMTNIHGRLQSQHRAILIDPIIAAARLMPALV